MDIYRCKKCTTKIPSDTHGVFVECLCKSIAVDGNSDYVRVIGNEDNIETIPAFREKGIWKIGV